MTNDQNDLEYAEPTVEEIRQFEIGEFVRNELREAVLDGLLESAKPHPDFPAAAYINRAIVARLEALLDERAVMGGEWAGVLLAATVGQTYNQLFGSEEADRATNDELAEALEQIIAEYANG